VAVEKIRALEAERFSVCALSAYEVLKGAVLSETLDETLDFLGSYPIVDLDSSAAEKAAEIYGVLRREGRVVPEFDILIAASAISSNSILVSGDEHFDTIREYVDGLELEAY
jgi:predicted nucleic acid-binding protein